MKSKKLFILLNVLSISFVTISPTLSYALESSNEVNEKSQRAIMRTVTFDSDGGSEVSPVQVEHGFLLSEPVAPTKEGYKFIGWYKEGWSTPFGFKYETILADTKLVAKWEKVVTATKHTVTFDSDGGSEVSPVQVEHAFLLPKPADPIKAGYKFVGWYREGWKIPFGFNYDTVMSDMTLVAKWEKIEAVKHTVTFDSDGGSEVSPVQVEHAFLLPKPADPIKAGYKFVGWYREGWNIPFGFNYDTVMSDMTLVAKWEKIEAVKHTVTFDSDGGSEVSPVQVEHAFLLPKPADPIKTGYKFVGWYREGWKIPFGFNYDTVMSDMTLVAKWEKIEAVKHTVTFDSAGGTQIAPVEVEHGFRVKEPVPPTRAGYTFKGWNKEGWMTPFGFSYEMITSDITLVAQWEKNIAITHTVTFDSDGGTPVASVEVEHGFLVSEPTPPTKTGYKFVGWYKEGWQIPFGFKYDTILADTKLVAKWEKIEDTKFTVTFNLGYDSLSYTQEISANGLLAEPVAPTRVGYRFVGWYSDVALTQAFDFTTPVTGAVNLYAKWQKINNGGVPTATYTVKFESNGGTIISDQVIELNGLVAKPMDPTKTGYKFDGWYSDVALTQVFDFSTPITKNTKLYAKWVKGNGGGVPVSTFVVKFNTDGGTNIPSQAVLSNGLITKPKDPIKKGYRFIGWYSDVALTQAYDFSTPVTGNVTLYAKWEKVSNGVIPISTYTVKFESNGGTIISDQVIELNGLVAKPMDPTKTGFKFDGWYLDVALTQAFDFTTPVTKDIKLYAKWVRTGNTVITTTPINKKIDKNVTTSVSNKELPKTGESKNIIPSILGVVSLVLLIIFRRKSKEFINEDM